MQILISKKGVRYRPICKNAHYFTSLIGQATLSEDNLRTIRNLGFEVIIT